MCSLSRAWAGRPYPSLRFGLRPLTPPAPSLAALRATALEGHVLSLPGVGRPAVSLAALRATALAGPRCCGPRNGVSPRHRWAPATGARRFIASLPAGSAAVEPGQEPPALRDLDRRDRDRFRQGP